ncbi:MAG TPA: Do family serine endopeptidase [Novosphingobium sp.]|nr:Do family serine endopeptidase [Novosphingobium sp.]
MKYAYGVTSALLMGGAALSLVSGLPAGAQVAQNEQGPGSSLVPRPGAPVSFADLTQQLQPAVVNIAVRQKVPVKNPLAGTAFGNLVPGGGGKTTVAEAVGSGFIISADGYIVTNNHVISLDREGQADEVTVKLADGRQFKARIVGRDADSDLAVLKIDAPAPLPFVKFGDSGKARAGDWIIAIGNPFGLGGSVTSGIISSVNRNTGTGAYDHYIQTDASINSGNSGGPMFDMAGNVIGINNWIVAPPGGNGGNIGIGFAIPSDTAKPIVERLKSGQAIERGYLGIQIQPISDEIADSLGLPHDQGELVRGVLPGMPAAKAGIQVGDIVLKVNGTPVNPDRTLSGIVSNVAPGTRIPVEVLRDGKRLTLYATVAKRPTQQELARSLGPTEKVDPFANPQQQGEGLAESALGLKVLNMEPEIAQQLGVPLSQKGVVIAGVEGGSDAATRGLQRGDIVVSANMKGVASVGELEGAIRAAKTAGRPSVTLQILRPGQPGLVYIAIRLS